MASVFLHTLFTLLSFLTFASSLSAHTITLSISPITTTSHTSPWERLSHLISASINRAHRLKHPNSKTSPIKTPISAHSYGAHSISLSFGTPQQTLPFIMETASGLVWYPCTPQYASTYCDNLPNSESTNMSIFDPDLSSSAKVLGCTNPKCGWLAPGVNYRCQGCQRNMKDCKQPCPPYFYMNGDKTSCGILLSETLRFPDKAVDDFVIGCSNITSIWPAGVAGFGRGPVSLPAQTGIKKFSYCLVSHEFDDMPKSSELVLYTGPSTSHSDATLKYTPFHRISETSFSVFKELYYLSLEKITVGGVDVKVPSKYLVPQSNGTGGLVVDSATMLTFLDKAVYDLVSQEFEMQTSEFTRAPDMEDQWGLKPCFIVPSESSVEFPEMTLHFQGGAEMEMEMVDYFPFADEQDLACMTLVTSDWNGAENVPGPSIIFANYQQQNLYMEFDLENERLGFRKQNC